MSRLQVVSWTQVRTRPRYLGQYGHVSGLNYTYACPGGADQLTCTLDREATFRDEGMNPGRIVQVICGASVIWEGLMLEPAPSTAGWTITAVGNGSWGSNFLAIYNPPWTTTTVDDAVNEAIVRGLRWVNPGVGAPAGGWLGQAVDSGAQTITDLLNLFCSNGGLTWYVGRGNILSVFALPTTPTRKLIATGPVVRTLAGNLNTIYERYQVSADSAGTAAVFALTSSQDATSVALYGTPMEDYVDLSSAGNLAGTAAQEVGDLILKRYQQATYGGPFTIRQGELLTVGGQPVDLAQEQAGTVVQLLMTEQAYAVADDPTDPVTFIVGNYAYDADTETAVVTPFQNLNGNEQEIGVEPWVTAALDPFAAPGLTIPPPPVVA